MIEQIAGRKPETINALAALGIKLIQFRDELIELSKKIDASRELVANPVAKSSLGLIANEAIVMSRHFEPVRVYAWEQLKKLNGERQ